MSKSLSGLTPHVIAALIAVATLAASANDAARAAEWGSLKGRFVYTGEAKNARIEPTKDVAYCSKHEITEQEIVVGENQGLKNVFVYIYLRRGATVDVNPKYLKEDLKPAVLDNKNCMFEPHALTVWTKQPLEIKNSDEGIGHNTNANLRNNASFNELVTNDKPMKKEFEKSESYPLPFSCNVHPWMKSYVLIRNNPYMAISNDKGEFEIKDLPAGEHKFVIWHETVGGIRDLEVGGDEADRRGTVELEIPAGETLDLGEIKVTPDLLGQ